MSNPLTDRVRSTLTSAKLTAAERRSVDDALRLADAVWAADERFDALGRRTSAGLLVADGTWRILYANDTSLALLDATRSVILGTALTDWLGIDALDSLRNVGETGQPPRIVSRSGLVVGGLPLRCSAHESKNIGPCTVVTLWRSDDGAADGPSLAGRLLPRALGDKLSERERGVLELLLHSGDIAAAAESLSISPHTVRNHLRNCYAKLGVHSESDLLRAVLHAAARRR